MQTYAGATLGQYVTQPFVDAFNKAANGEMVIELFFADQIVPTGELFRAMQAGTIDAVHSDDDSMASPVEVGLFGGYFPFATRSILDVPVLFQQYGLGDIWREAYSGTGVVWLSAAGQDPCNFNTKKEITSVADLDGLKLYTFPTAGRFLTQFGVVPVSIPYEDAEVAVQTGELDGMSWSGITEDYTVGWADVTDYFLTNNISGAWIGSWFANEEKWNALPEHLKQLYISCMEADPYLP
jgi:TRAP-type mannitol/chloroaromatic compound transport system substrate-binding protein